MKQILQAYALPKETALPLKMLYKNTKAMVCLTDDNIEFIDIISSLARRYTASQKYLVFLNFFISHLKNVSFS